MEESWSNARPIIGPAQGEALFVHAATFPQSSTLGKIHLYLFLSCQNFEFGLNQKHDSKRACGDEECEAAQSVASEGQSKR
jgi:hypothetical protein